MRSLGLLLLAGCVDTCIAYERPPAPGQGVYGVLYYSYDYTSLECGESGRPSIEICARRSDAQTVCTRTDSQGGYQFDLSPGRYQMCLPATLDCSEAFDIRPGEAVVVDHCGVWSLGGACDDEPAPSEPPARPPPVVPPLQWVFIVDDSWEEVDGSPGADICDVSAFCAGDPVPRVRADLNRGGGIFACDDPALGPCPTDGRAAIDATPTCSNVEGDAVSLGISGTLTVAFSRDLQRCRVEVDELADADESYEVYLCYGPDPSYGCTNRDQPLGISDGGGPLAVEVPTEQP